jgi:hypothetical protein
MLEFPNPKDIPPLPLGKVFRYGKAALIHCWKERLDLRVKDMSLTPSPVVYLSKEVPCVSQAVKEDLCVSQSRQ